MRIKHAPLADSPAATADPFHDESAAGPEQAAAAVAKTDMTTRRHPTTVRAMNSSEIHGAAPRSAGYRAGGLPPAASAPRRPEKAPFVSMLDLVVLTGALLVSFAAALMLQTQLHVGWEVAAVAALAVFAIAATLHVLLQRTDEIARLRAQIGVLEQEIGTLRHSTAAMPGSLPHQVARRRSPIDGTAGPLSSGDMEVSPTENMDHDPFETLRQSRRGLAPTAQEPPGEHADRRVVDTGAIGRRGDVEHAIPDEAPDEGWMAPPQRQRPPDVARSHSPMPTRNADLDPAQDHDLALRQSTPSTVLIQAASSSPTDAAATATTPKGELRAPRRPITMSIDPSAPETAGEPPMEPGKKRGFFAGLAGRLKKPAKPAETETIGPVLGSMPDADVPQARQRIVSGWQGDRGLVARAIGAEPAVDLPRESRIEPARGAARPPSEYIAAPLRSEAHESHHDSTTGEQHAASADRHHVAAARTQAEPHETWPDAWHRDAEAGAPHPGAPVDDALREDEVAATESSADRHYPAPGDAIEMPPPADMEQAGYEFDSNPVDALIQTIANRLAAEREGVSTEELLALPAPYPDELGDDDGQPTAEPLSPEASALAQAVRTAVEAGRVEVHLQPILALDGLATVSYEAFPRLRDEAGMLIKPADYLAFAHRAGLNPGIEKLALLRAIHVLQQLDARGKLSPIFINVSQELLSDGSFFSTFVEAMKGTRNLSQNLVLEFAQPVAAAFTERDLESLDTLARLGFTFALDDVDHVEMDFEPLISRGLAFVKITADSFAQGLIAGEARIPTDEIRLLFEDAGLQVIVHRIGSEAGLDVALAHNVVFGQGNLFAEPKPIKAEVLSDTGRAA